MPFFSLLIAHYNNYDYFVECYRSIQQQTYRNFEVIIVDDCSTDDSLEKIRVLTENHSRIKIYQNEVNKGVGYTKRKCAELATGEFCSFLDPDDALVNTAIEDALSQFTSDEISAVYSQFVLCDQNLKRDKIFSASDQIKNNNPLFFNIFLEANHFFTFRKSAYNKTSGINENLTSAVDQDLYLKLYETGDFKFVKKPLYLYRLHDKGVSQEKSKKTKLNHNWHNVLLETLKRRKITSLYNENVSEIKNLPEFIFSKQNTFYKKLLRRFS